MKMFEIGLGCDMGYGPGASVALHKALFPQAELWEAEYDGKCVEKAKERQMLEGIQVVVGDQGNDTTLDSWINETGGEFDVVIDDGLNDVVKVGGCSGDGEGVGARDGIVRDCYLNKDGSTLCIDKDDRFKFSNLCDLLEGLC